jgi:pimeloyl-ACP methyl ester carboxylesterase
MQPFYFGTSREQLFGVYHSPEVSTRRSSAVVMCQPIGHEYLRAHRAIRNLAAALAENGFHVLRFDYLGSGDSSGDGDRTTISQSLADLATAIDELKDMSGATRVTLVGLRMGAALAALVAGQRRDVERIVLWDPIVDGGAYLAGLKELQGQWLEDRFGKGTGMAGAADELMGFPLPELAERQLAAVKILPLPALRARTGVSLFVSEERPDYLTLRDELAATQLLSTYALVPGAGEWDRPDQAHQILLPHAMVRAIATAMSA